uniref:Integrase catalytic domain-containing protein n=1 Tax=Tanacetum cinerariifolium TaxID=118510 RepID=A0A6L2MQ15_TANCI|nr:hypothetical protein [Tanacetum cinerariifolium]
MVAFLSKSDASAGFDQIVDFLNAQDIQYALMVNPTIYVSCIKQFWTKDVIRQALRLDDVDGVECLPNEKIFTELARMGYEKPPPKLTFYKAFFSTQWKFLIHTIVQCVSTKRTAWNEFSCSMASTVIYLATVIINAQVDDLSSHINQYTTPALTQKVFANMRRVGKGFCGVETPLFATMLVQPQPPVAEEEDGVEVPAAPIPPSITNASSPPLQEPITTPPQAQPAPPSSPPQEQQTDTSGSSMSILNTLMETYATLSQKVAHLEQDKIAQALEIIKLKKRVKKLEKKRISKSLGLKRLRKVGTSQRVESSTETVVGAQEDASKQGARIEAIDADEEITLVDMETQADLGVELQGRKDYDNAAIKDASAAEPTVFDDEEEVEQAAAKEKQEKDDLQKAKVLQQQYVDKNENIDWNVVVEQMQEKHIDNIKKYQSRKRKPISIAQARKNMIVYLKNMTGYKMEHFKGMNYDNVRPIFEREYNKVQTLFKPDKYVEEPQKKRVAEETLLQESFKKLKAVEVSCSESTQDTPTIDPKEMSKEDVKNMLELVPVSKFNVEALQVKYPLIDWEIHSEGSRTYWKIIRVDTEDVMWKLQRYMHYPLLWKLHSNCGVHQVSSTTRRHDMFMLTKKDCPLSNGVMTLMLSTKLQVEEDSEMARDLVMEIFMKANQPKSRGYILQVIKIKKLDGLLGNESRTANILEPMTLRHSTVSKTTMHSNSFAAHRDCPIHHRLWVLKAHDEKSQATSSQAWLWYRRLFHLNFDTINLLSKIDIVVGLPMLKFIKDHLCSSLIVDDYSRYTWTHFLRSKDETPEVLIDFLRLVKRGRHAQVRIIQTDKGTKFLNKTLHAYFASEGIHHQTSIARTPKQNGVVERRNRTIVEAARTMLSATKVPLFFRLKQLPLHVLLKTVLSDGENLDKMKEKEMVEENAQVENDEFINIFCTPVQDRGKTSSRHVDSSNMHTFYQHHPSEHRWTKDHPLEQVIGNPSLLVRTSRQLESDGKMCMFALTMS